MLCFLELVLAATVVGRRKKNSHSLNVDFEYLIPRHYLLVVYADFKALI
jgi:hypothetical protein